MMDSIEHTLNEYTRSAGLIRGRIDEINELLYGRTALPTGETIKNLEKRRFCLYGELVGLCQAAEEMREYLRQVEAAAG